MRYNPLGQTGLLVSELCLGTMTFGSSEGMWSQIAGLGQDESEALVRSALDGGINFLDTAYVYSEGRSEEITGRALKNLGVAREDVVVATKGFGRVGSAPGPNRVGASRAHILAACKASLKRLGLDHVDLYQLHGFDALTPIEEMLEALDVLVRHGHVRYVGVSNWAAWQVAKALGIAERRHLAPPRSLQSYYTLAGRDLEREIVPMLLSERVGLMVWSPLAGGLLSGKYDLGEEHDTTQGGGRRATFDFPPVERPRARRRGGASRRRGREGLHRGAGGDRLAPAPARGDERHRRGEAAGPARRQCRRRERGAEPGGSRQARRRERSPARVPRLDDRAAIGTTPGPAATAWLVDAGLGAALPAPRARLAL